MNTFWSSKTQKLIELLYEHSYVLDRDNPQYKKKTTRMHGYSMIANKLNTTESAVKHKISNLKCKYRIERQKINSSKKLGVYYRPLLSWFNDFSELMESIKQSSESGPQYSEENMLKEDNATMESSQDEEEDSGEEPKILEEGDSGDTIVVSISQEYIDEINEAQKNVNVAPKSFRRIQKPITRKQQPIDPPDSVIETSEGPVRDEFQMFAEHVAEQLKMMPTESAMNLQSNIQNMLDEAFDTD